MQHFSVCHEFKITQQQLQVLFTNMKTKYTNTKGFKGIDSYDCVFTDVCVFMEASVVADCIADASVRAVIESGDRNTRIQNLQPNCSLI
jgi:hypothetical protein